MHSHDAAKQGDVLGSIFWLEIKSILAKPAGSTAMFQRFVFPALMFSQQHIALDCDFSGAIFTQDVDFASTKFTGAVDFGFAKFTCGANFRLATFEKHATFADAKFKKAAEFYKVRFLETAVFSTTKFLGEVNFTCSSFAAAVNFAGAIFKREVRFDAVYFADKIDFFCTDFYKRVDLSNVTFAADAHFEISQFRSMANFSSSSFLGSAEFRRCDFITSSVQEPSGIFARASFSKPEEVIFDDVDLSSAMFHNCDVSKIQFTSSVRWRTNGDRKVLFEESVPMGGLYYQEDLDSWVGAEQRNYRALAQIYQQLKKNYDARLDYSSADDFHYGEMEMRRMVAARWHRNLSLIAWYKYASDYGNSFTKPLYWLAGVLLLFALLYPLPGLGLQQTGKPYTETYASAWRAAHGLGQRIWWEVALFLKGLLTAVDTAVFQKSPMYTMANPLGHAFTIAEMLLTSTLFALFLLAIRRQFRR